MTVEGPTIRPARQEDAPALATLLRSLFPKVAAETQEATVTRVARHLAQNLADTSHTILVAEAEEGLVGYAAVHWLPYLILTGPEGFVSELFLHEGARGDGLGSRLLATIEAEAQRRGCARLHLINLRTRESYQRGFYAKQGWQERPAAASFVRTIGETP